MDLPSLFQPLHSPSQSPFPSTLSTHISREPFPLYQNELYSFTLSMQFPHLMSPNFRSNNAASTTSLNFTNPNAFPHLSTFLGMKTLPTLPYLTNSSISIILAFAEMIIKKNSVVIVFRLTTQPPPHHTARPLSFSKF